MPSPAKPHKRAACINYLSRFNVNTLVVLRTWTDPELRAGVRFIQSELARRTT